MECQRFAINVLAADQMALAKRFAASGGDKFQTLPHSRGIGGAPLLKDCTAWFECSVAARHEAGDHVIIIGHVDRFESSGRPGLLFIGGSFFSAGAVVSVPSTGA
jgi:flavin reductase (DIM6/NTAB) family NADH-FMN oxidoreductase RutF